MADLKSDDSGDAQQIKVIFASEADGAIEPDNAQLTQVRRFPNARTLKDITNEVGTSSIAN